MERRVEKPPVRGVYYLNHEKTCHRCNEFLGIVASYVQTEIWKDLQERDHEKEMYWSFYHKRAPKELKAKYLRSEWEYVCDKCMGLK